MSVGINLVCMVFASHPGHIVVIDNFSNTTGMSDFRMTSSVLTLAVLMFVVHADHLVLQLDGELGSFPDSMILTKIQMGVIDPTPVVNEKGQRYFVQIATNNVVVYPSGMQTILPLARRLTANHRLVPMKENIQNCKQCSSSQEAQSNPLSLPASPQKSVVIINELPVKSGSVETPIQGRPSMTSPKRNVQAGPTRVIKPMSSQIRPVSPGTAPFNSRVQQNRRVTATNALKNGPSWQKNVTTQGVNMPEGLSSTIRDAGDGQSMDTIGTLVNSFQPLPFSQGRFNHGQQNTQSSQSLGQGQQPQYKVHLTKEKIVNNPVASSVSMTTSTSRPESETVPTTPVETNSD